MNIKAMYLYSKKKLYVHGCYIKTWLNLTKLINKFKTKYYL